MPRRPEWGSAFLCMYQSRKAGKPKPCKLTDVREPSVPSGVAEPEGKQMIQASSHKFGMERVFAVIRNGRLGGHILDQTTGY